MIRPEDVPDRVDADRGARLPKWRKCRAAINARRRKTAHVMLPEGCEACSMT